MVLNKIREKIRPIINCIGKYFSKTGFPAWFWTIFGIIFALVAMSFYMQKNFLNAFLGGLFYLLSGFMDVVDGAVANYTRTVSKMGSFIDSTADRIAEIIVFFGIMVGGWAPPDIIFLGITFSLLVSYVRAKAESLNIEIKGRGWGERAERMIVLSVLSMLGQPYYGIVIVSALAVVTFIQRCIIIMGALK
ncbi:MAG: CDP-alcohol phosphatidyltransferase family protein [Nitrososphaeria archaeon]|nr:CDP-alcohol phosphatidyltransferase family protein [Nitrososphaeria archaeon]